MPTKTVRFVLAGICLIASVVLIAIPERQVLPAVAAFALFIRLLD